MEDGTALSFANPNPTPTSDKALSDSTCMMQLHERPQYHTR